MTLAWWTELAMSTKQACERYWGRDLRRAKLGEREEQYAVGLKETLRVSLEPELCFVWCSFPLFFLLFQAYGPSAPGDRFSAVLLSLNHSAVGFFRPMEHQKHQTRKVGVGGVRRK